MFPKARHKFNAKACKRGTVRFDSQGERAYFDKLEIMRKNGVILGFLRQVPLHLQSGIKYVLDFLVFYANGDCEGIEFKGYETKEWKIKKALVDLEYPWLEIRVVK